MKEFQCNCCGKQTRNRGGMLGGRLSCGCDSARCGVCHKCHDHCTCEWGREANIQKIVDAGEKRMKEIERQKNGGFGRYL